MPKKSTEVAVVEPVPLRPQWPAFNVEVWPIKRLAPYAKNARTHSPDQVEQIARSMEEFGWTIPILVADDGEIIAGHGRLLAAAKLSVVEAPVLIAKGWTDAQKRAYRLADNKLAENAGWDRDLLVGELRALSGMLDLSVIGFSEADLAKLLMSGTEGLTHPDFVPDTPVTPVTTVGDVWLLGKHRLLCGDATKAEDVAKVLAGVQPHLMVTDPPYGAGYDPAWRGEAHKSGKLKRRSVAANNSTGTVTNDDRADWREAWALFPGDVAYVWAAPGPLQVVSFGGLDAAGFEVRQQIIWAKEHFAIGRGNYHYQHEPCWYAVRKGAAAHWCAGRDQSTLWRVASNNGFRKESTATGHSTQKPVELMRRAIENNSSPGQAVYDPFVGSGTAIIAAEMTARACHAIELAPVYADVSVKRWQQFTGKAAVLEGDGRTFDEIAGERLTSLVH